MPKPTPVRIQSVRMGDIRVAGPNSNCDQLQTLLGSCVGLLVCVTTTGARPVSAAGLAHILLPRAPETTPPSATGLNHSQTTPGRYANTAVDELLLQLRRQIQQWRREDIDQTSAVWGAHLAGGSNMFISDGDASETEVAGDEPATPNGNTATDEQTWAWNRAVGDQNVLEVQRCLSAVGIPILSQDCGGSLGRQLTYDVRTSTLSIRRIPRPSVSRLYHARGNAQ